MRKQFLLDWLLPLVGWAAALAWAVASAATEPHLSRFQGWTDAVVSSRVVAVCLVLTMSWWIARTLKDEKGGPRYTVGMLLQICGFSILFMSVEPTTALSGVLLGLVGFALMAGRRRPSKGNRENATEMGPKT